MTPEFLRCRHAQPKFAESADGSGDALSTHLFDLGVRFWTLKRRQPAHYAIIRSMTTLASPYTKEVIDIDADADEVPHAFLDRAITVLGGEDVVYVDIALNSAVWLEVRLDAGGDGRGAWVRLLLVEGSAVVLPCGVSYRVRVPGKGMVGLIRGIMPVM